MGELVITEKNLSITDYIKETMEKSLMMARLGRFERPTFGSGDLFPFLVKFP